MATDEAVGTMEAWLLRRFSAGDLEQLCGTDGDSLAPGNQTAAPANLGTPCFQRLFLATPAHLALAIVTAYHLGKNFDRSHFIRPTLQRASIIIRATSISCLILLTAAREVAPLLSQNHSAETRGQSAILSTSIELISWVLLCIYLKRLVQWVHPSPRGHRSVSASWAMVAVAYSVQIWTDFYLLSIGKAVFHDPTLGYFIVVNRCIFVSLYTLALLVVPPLPFSGRVHADSGYEELPGAIMAEPTDALESQRPDGHLGVAKANSGYLSRLLFYWVNPLINMDHVRSPEEVFDLPADLSTQVVAEKTDSQKENLMMTMRANPSMHPTRRPQAFPLLKLLAKAYWKPFLALGVLRFLADGLGLCGPLLLNRIISFLEEDESSPLNGQGYLYAVGLTASTLLAALCVVHFNLGMAELNIKIRAAIISLIYRHIVRVPSRVLASEGETPSGKDQNGRLEVLNLVGVDASRILNLGCSLHALWSLPLQFGVALAILYQQVGTACFASVFLTLALLPINKLIADKIGSLTSRMMAAKDERVSLVAEMLAGIRVVKFYTWDLWFRAKVEKVREEELSHLRGLKYLDAFCVFFWATTPVLISVSTFSAYVLMGNQLTAAKVFTAMALFSSLTGPLNSIPWVLNGVLEAMASVKRVSSFLSLEIMEDCHDEDIGLGDHDEDGTETCCISVVDGSFSYSTPTLSLGQTEEQHPLTSSTLSVASVLGGQKLSGIDVEIAKGELVGVIGKVGSGKSSLLLALLGEMKQVGGQMTFKTPWNGVGFVQQEPWLQQGNIRDNILFGKPFNQTLYNKVIEACCLQEDLASLPRGDLTEVGEAGSALSGGQKARITLARAVYQEKEVYLIDDIYSSLDASVAAKVHQKCILGLLAKKTRLLCTHHVKFLKSASKVLHMEGGRLLTSGPPLTVFNNPEVASYLQQGPESQAVSSSTTSSLCERNEDGQSQDEEDQKNFSCDLDENSSNAEVLEIGAVHLVVYRFYLSMVGWGLSILILISLLLMEGSKDATDIWLAHWVSSSNATNSSSSSSSEYLTVYGSMAAGNAVMALARAFLFAYGGIKAARAVHRLLMDAITGGRMSFFDSTPAGRILNRIGPDLASVDDSLPFILNIFLAQMFGVAIPVAVCVYAVPWILVVLVPLCFGLYDLQRRYRPASRDLRRVASASRSPLFSHLSETVRGLSTVRAMKAVPRFVRDNEEKTEGFQKTDYASSVASVWLDLRLQLVGCAVVSGVAFVAVIQHHLQGGGSAVNPGLIGLAISYALSITSRLSGLLSAFVSTEKEMVAVERCHQYITEIPQEENHPEASTDSPTENGRTSDEGVVSFEHVNFRYREHLPWALKDFTFRTKPKEKVGIVGRTGAGKSTIFQALFRTADLDKRGLVGGRIMLDGVDIHQVDLRTLRKRLAIIPQEPFVFSGTLRENLDPLGLSSDDTICDALKKCKLGSVVRPRRQHMSTATETISATGGLDAKIGKGSSTFSMGQKQLLCLARAILSNASVVCVDEATSNVDLSTDKVVQEVLSSEFGDRTVLTIAHRVDTILGADRVIVMADGRIVEDDLPKTLLENPNSAFSKHVAAGLSSSSLSTAIKNNAGEGPAAL